MNRPGYLSLLGAFFFGCLSSAHAQEISLYLSAPKTQSTIFTSTTVETFDATAGHYTSNFSSVIGTYTLSSTNAFNILADNQYGSGTGQYMAFGAQSGTSGPITLTFSAPQSYFGFSWNAGDNNNGIAIYNGATLLRRFSTATIRTMLSGPTVTAIDSTVYNSSQYFGKPPAGTSNSGEPYAFLNFIASGGTFTSIVFDNSGSTGSGFETDNHTIRASSVTPNGSFVFVSTSAPEPATWVLASLGMIFLGRRRIQRA